MEDDDDKPISAIIASKRAAAQNETGDTSDSEDDLPIAELVRKRDREANGAKGEANKKAKKADDAKKKETSTRNSTSEKNNKKSDDTKSKSSNNESSSLVRISLKEYIGQEFYEQTLKGKLVQCLLRRWWYVQEWPNPKDIPTPPIGYEALDGFPGVFISTRADTLGKIMDTRDPTTRPCLTNYMNKTSTDLKDMCIQAYKNQMKILIEHEGEECPLLIQLKLELNEISSIDPHKADVECTSIISKLQEVILDITKSMSS